MTRGPLRRLLSFVAVSATLALGAGCGEEESLEVEEGEPVELGELSYNVQLTRFLNPAVSEDEAYLHGQPEAPAGQSYLAVFMLIENEGDEPGPVDPGEMRIVDTRDSSFEPVESTSEYALQPGATVPADGELPEPGSIAASGPIQGSMVLFLVREEITENRPVELEIPGPTGETGLVELDI
jgi:hypothetical protein